MELGSICPSRRSTNRRWRSSRPQTNLRACLVTRSFIFVARSSGSSRAIRCASASSLAAMKSRLGPIGIARCEAGMLKPLVITNGRSEVSSERELCSGATTHAIRLRRFPRS